MRFSHLLYFFAMVLNKDDIIYRVNFALSEHHIVGIRKFKLLELWALRKLFIRFIYLSS